MTTISDELKFYKHLYVMSYFEYLEVEVHEESKRLSITLDTFFTGLNVEKEKLHPIQ